MKRTDDNPRPAVTTAQAEGFVNNYREILEGVLELDILVAHHRLEKGLALRMPATGSMILEALDLCQENLVLAKKLAARARREYELFKEAHETWIELRKSAARTALEEAKKEGELKKQITNDMILDQVRATFSVEYMGRVEKLKNFQAAVHVLEELAEAWRERPRSLLGMKDVILALGSATRGR